MLTTKGFISLIVCVSFLSASCSASISRQGYVIDNSKATQTDCPNTIVVRNLDYDPALVAIVGKISASDSGFSVECSETFVIDSFKKDACAIGADVVNITTDSQPNFWSTCYSAEAELLRIKDRDKLIDLKENPRYSAKNVGNRSKYTECMNDGIIAAGVLGGLIGGLILHSICNSRYAEKDDSGDGRTVSSSDETMDKDGPVKK